jgi:hypothetical protein
MAVKSAPTTARSVGMILIPLHFCNQLAKLLTRSAEQVFLPAMET